MVPPHLQAALNCRVLVCQPRRLAAILAARFLEADYQVRYQQQLSGHPLRFVTHGMALRYLLGGALSEFGLIILDEFHERQLDSDVLLARLLKLRSEERPELKLLIMSATLEVEVLERHLGVRAISSEGRLYPVELSYQNPDPMAPLAEKVAGAFSPTAGHTLVFLPGMRDLRACAERINYPHTYLLHGRLDSDEALRPSSHPKLILATNVAESSVTIDGVTTVIDSGLARVARCSPWSGVTQLRVERISQASAIQRAGRAGRTGPGRCVRLYSQAEFENLDPFDTPEILRTDLSHLLLELRVAGLTAAELDWLTPPTPDRLEAAHRCLSLLGALDPKRAGLLARWPLPVRWAHFMEVAQDMGMGAEAVRVVAGHEAEPAPDPLFPRQRDQRLERLLMGQLQERPPTLDGSLRRALFLAFADRVARLYPERLVPAFGPGLQRTPGLACRTPLAVVVAADEYGKPRATSISEVEPEWLWESMFDQFEETVSFEWDAKEQRVARVQSIRLGNLILEETKCWPPPGPEVAEVLAENLPEKLRQSEEVVEFLIRAGWLHQTDPEFPKPPELEQFWAQACRWYTSVKELSQGLPSQLETLLDYPQRQRLERELPRTLELPRRRKPAKVNYPAEGKPWVAAKIAEFMGIDSTPTLAGGKVPLLFHILAPNFRPVQVTDDLLGFWERTYPRVRSELRGRYPKHPWPENPCDR